MILTCNAYEFFSPIGQSSFSLDPSAKLSKLGELVLGTTEADKDDSAAPPDLQVDMPGDSPTKEPSQESSPGEVQEQSLVRQFSAWALDPVIHYSHSSGEELERVSGRPRGEWDALLCSRLFHLVRFPLLSEKKRKGPHAVHFYGHILWLTSDLQSWSKVMVHLAFFDNFTVPSPLSPHTMFGHCAQSVPLEATLYGGGGEGGGPSLGKRTTFIIEQGAIMKTKQIFNVYHILLTRIVCIRRVEWMCPQLLEGVTYQCQTWKFPHSWPWAYVGIKCGSPTNSWNFAGNQVHVLHVFDNLIVTRGLLKLSHSQLNAKF